MKPYMVAVYRPQNTRTVALYSPRAGGNTGRGHVNYHQKEQAWPGILDASYNYDVYFFDGEQDANDWAEGLLAEHPTAQIIVGKSMTVYHRRMLPVESVKFTDKGPLPV